MTPAPFPFITQAPVLGAESSPLLNLYVDILTLSFSECDCISRTGL